MDSPGFLSSLLDRSFSRFIAIRMVTLLYTLAMVAAGVVGLAIVVAGLASGSSLGVLAAVVMGPLVALLQLVAARIGLELVLVAFRIADNTDQLLALARSGARHAPSRDAPQRAPGESLGAQG